MDSKAYRWWPNSRRFPTAGKDHPESGMMMAAAKLYERIARDFDGEKKETGTMDTFVKS